MARIKIPNTYSPCTVLSAELGSSEKNNTPFIALEISEDATGDTITGFVYLSEKALEGSVKTLRDVFGFNDDFESVIEQIVNKPCSIVVEAEVDDSGKERIRVKWINNINKVRSNKPIENATGFLQALSSKAKRIVREAPASGAPARPMPAPRPAAPARPPMPAPRPRPAAAPATPPAPESNPFGAPDGSAPY